MYNPFPVPIQASDGVIQVNVREFSSLPNIGDVPARMMLLVDEPGTRRLFVNDMQGPLYSISYDGTTVTKYLDLSETRWGFKIEAGTREQGFQSFAFHPEFARDGAPGFGRFYTYADISLQTAAPPDFTTIRPQPSHDTVLLEWKALTKGATTYDGGAPRALMRFRQPHSNHNGGHTTFNPLAARGGAEFGLLYVGVADGGGEGDRMKLSQNLGSGFGKIFRIDPLGTNSANGQYGIPASNPMLGTSGALPEIYAYGTRNPQRFGWDAKNGRMFVADIGQRSVEEISVVTPGANLGWNVWEGSFRFAGIQGVGLENPRSAADVTYPVVEWDHFDPLLLPSMYDPAHLRSTVVTGVVVYRGRQIPQLSDRLIFGDMSLGEIFHVSADHLPDGGQAAIRRILLNHNGAAKTMVELIREKNAAQGKPPARRSDLRFGQGPNGQVFLLNKSDGTIRVLVP